MKRNTGPKKLPDGAIFRGCFVFLTMQSSFAACSKTSKRQVSSESWTRMAATSAIGDERVKFGIRYRQSFANIRYGEA